MTTLTFVGDTFISSPLQRTKALGLLHKTIKKDSE